MHLVRLRNPHGNGTEWEGSWGDKDDENWKSISEEDKEKFKVVKNKDGEFYMAFGDFLEFFGKLDVVHIRPDSMLDCGGKNEKMEVFHFNGSWEGETAGGCGNDGWGEFHLLPLLQVLKPLISGSFTFTLSLAASSSAH